MLNDRWLAFIYNLFTLINRTLIYQMDGIASWIKNWKCLFEIIFLITRIFIAVAHGSKCAYWFVPIPNCLSKLFTVFLCIWMCPCHHIFCCQIMQTRINSSTYVKWNNIWIYPFQLIKMMLCCNQEKKQTKITITIGTNINIFLDGT